MNEKNFSGETPDPTIHAVPDIKRKPLSLNAERIQQLSQLDQRALLDAVMQFTEREAAALQSGLESLQRVLRERSEGKLKDPYEET